MQVQIPMGHSSSCAQHKPIGVTARSVLSTNWLFGRLDGKHVVFGEVIEGMALLQKMDQQGSQSGKPKVHAMATCIIFIMSMHAGGSIHSGLWDGG